MTAMLVIAVLYWRADGVILSLTSTTDQVGIYGLAYTLAFTLTAVATFFQSSTMSTMVHSFTQDHNAFGAFVGRSMEAMLFIAAPIAVLGTVLSGPIIALVGSSSFVPDGGPTVALLFSAMALTFLTGVLSQALFAVPRPDIPLAIESLQPGSQHRIEHLPRPAVRAPSGRVSHS